jgi:predicted GNAT family acetyltransferase
MHDVQLKVNKEEGRGKFFIEKDTREIAEMVVAIKGDSITVFHTEVIDELRGKGVASQLLFALIEYARDHKKRIIPLCVYVRGQFDLNPDKYADVWDKTWHH